MNNWLPLLVFILSALYLFLLFYVWSHRKNFFQRLHPPPPTRKGPPRRILVIGAHPDDLKMACGGTLMRMYREGHTIHGLILHHNPHTEQPHLPRAIHNPQNLFYGLNEVTYLELPELSLSGELTSIRKAIDEKIRTFHPEIILTPSDHDQHTEHQLIHYATMQAGQQVFTILCYESLTATKDFKPNLFVGIEEYLDDKIETMLGSSTLLNPSSTNRIELYLQAHIRAHARSRGAQARTTYAEGFEIRRALMMDGGTF